LVGGRRRVQSDAPGDQQRLGDLAASFSGEVGVAPVAVSELSVRHNTPGQAALVERDPHDDTDAVLGAGLQKLLLGEEMTPKWSDS
jgi:hypothetical protein